MPRLRTALRWSRAPYFQHLNVGDTQKKLRSEELVEIEMALRVLTPMDIWLYSWAAQALSKRQLPRLDICWQEATYHRFGFQRTTSSEVASPRAAPLHAVPTFSRASPRRNKSD
eukprot:s4730_g5.t1